MSDDTYELEFVTSVGLPLTARLTVDDLRDMRASGAYSVDPELDEAEAFRRILRTRIAYLVDTDEGSFVCSDHDGREWVIPQSSVIAGSFREPGTYRGRQMGFGPIDSGGAIRPPALRVVK